MQDRVLIIKGVKSTDELSKFGDLLAKEYQKADFVYLIDNLGNSYQAKYKKNQNISIVKFFDANQIAV